MPFDLTGNVHVDFSDDGSVQHLEHFQQPFVAANSETAIAAAEQANAPFVAATTPQALAAQYLQEVAPIYGLQPSMLPDSNTGDNLSGEESSSGSELDLIEEKQIMETVLIAYQQTYNNLPIWEAGVSVTIQSNPLRVTASQSSVHKNVELPAQEGLTDAHYASEAITAEVLRSLLGLPAKRKPTINEKRELIYQYDPDRRLDPESQQSGGEALHAGPPTLPLPTLPADITAGQHYVVSEVLFTLTVEGYGPVHWRAFIEVNSGAVLYLRAFIACATGMIYATDPVTASGTAVLPTAPAPVLNPFRSTISLAGLDVANPQELSGEYVQLVDNNAPVVVPPTQSNPPANFFYNAPTREFAAVNAYHHCDWLFRLMQEMGFNVASYFDGTNFPVPVDASAFNDAVNARAPGNALGVGSGGFQFGLAGQPFPSVSIAADVRVVLHEFGHALLWDSVHSPNFGFAHSAGDSLAAILLDPESALRSDPVRRFETFPWILPNRNHGRDVAAGWGWGGVNDVGSYSSEQILSTTHFRLYRSLGGDAGDVNRRKLAARQVAYLIFRAIGSLATNPVTPTPNPSIYATALMNADIGTNNFEGHRGGAFHKVVRWSFEKQGLYQPAGAPRPVTRPGAAPAVDLYIDDGRGGEYTYQPVHWENLDIWNRLTPSAGGHETPVVGQTNHAYVRVKNRGTQAATNVVVRGYSADPGAGLSWPDDWTPMDTPSINVAGNIAAGGDVVVGPFEWTPQVVGHECMFMEVSSSDDRSNIDASTFFPCAVGPTAEWRLVPYDNNLGQRNVAPVPGAGGLRGLLSAFEDRRFVVHNPFDKQARIQIKAELPTLLAKRQWRVRLNQKVDGAVFGLCPASSRPVTISLSPGGDFSRDEVIQAGKDSVIRLYVYADGIIIGGMSYALDPELDWAPKESPQDQRATALQPLRATRLSREDTQLNGIAAQFLSDLGVDTAATGRVHRVSLRKLTVDIEVDEE